MIGYIGNIPLQANQPATVQQKCCPNRRVETVWRSVLLCSPPEILNGDVLVGKFCKSKRFFALWRFCDVAYFLWLRYVGLWSTTVYSVWYPRHI